MCFREDRVEAVAECITAIDGVPKGRNEAVAALSSENFRQHIRDWIGEEIGTA